MLTSFCVLGVCLIWGWASADTSVNEPLTIASFNIQNLGNSKFSKKDVMPIVHRIILRYDAIFIQEIVTKNEDLMKQLVADVNKQAPEGVTYDIAISERLGSTNAKEQYAFIYRKEKLSVKSQEVYPDSNYVDFERPPFIVQFQSSTTRDFTSFIAVGIHTQPTKTVHEISELANVYDYVKKKYKMEDVILMGDMNAGCGYVPIRNWTEINLYTRPEFNWMISHDVDTTNALSSCPYDRFIVAGKKLNSGVIPESAHAFDYMTEYHLSESEAAAVSDHKVIEIKFRGKVSNAVTRYIETDVCLEVQDTRPIGKIPVLSSSKARKLQNVDISTSGSTWIATANSNNLDDIYNTVLQLRESMPNIISDEVIDTVRYKVNSKVLEDNTSFLTKSNVKYLLTVECDSKTNLSKTRICKETNPN